LKRLSFFWLLKESFAQKEKRMVVRNHGERRETDDLVCLRGGEGETLNLPIQIEKQMREKVETVLFLDFI